MPWQDSDVRSCRPWIVRLLFAGVAERTAADFKRRHQTTWPNKPQSMQFVAEYWAKFQGETCFTGNSAKLENHDFVMKNYLAV